LSEELAPRPAGSNNNNVCQLEFGFSLILVIFYGSSQFFLFLFSLFCPANLSKMAPAMATKRLRKELVKFQKEPPPGVIAEPDEANILKWYYVIRGRC